MTRFVLIALILISISARADDVAGSNVPKGAMCDEKKTSIEDLDKLVRSPGIKSQQDFLDRIPEGVMTNYTFVTNSQSLHRGSGDHKVSSEWPRVIRSSIDGKITMSYICDPNNPAFGKVETLYTDEKTNEVKSVEWDFSKQMKSSMAASRVHDNPISCVGCHAGSTIKGKPYLKHNWAEYFFWGDCQRDRGITVYGMSDDRMNPSNFEPRFSHQNNSEDCTDSADRKAYQDSINDYKKFRQAQNNNPCFTSLPGFKIPEDHLGNSDWLAFPYRNDTRRGRAFAGGPNNILTKAYAPILAKRNVQMMKQGKENYRLFKYYLAMDGAGCLTDQERQKVVDLLKKQMGQDPDADTDTEYKYFQGSILYAFAKGQGLHDKDWTMEFHVDDNPRYNVGVSSIPSIMEGEILEDLTRENPAVKKALADSGRQMYKYYGFAKNLQCLYKPLKQIGPPVDQDDDPQPPADENSPPAAPKPDALCRTLRSENSKQLKAALKAAEKCAVSAVMDQAKKIIEVAQQSREALDKAAIDRGRELVSEHGKGKCVTCHSAGADSGLPPDYRFVPDEKASADQLKESQAVLHARMQEGFLKTIDNRLIKTKTMPPFDTDLNDRDRGDIKAYLQSLSTGN